MISLGLRARRFSLLFKIAIVVVGIAIIVISLGYMVDEFSLRATGGLTGLPDIITIICIVAGLISGTVLSAGLPNAIRVRFSRRRSVESSTPVYGFGTVFAVGLGATLGSPLFILIPENILQYELVSIISLIIAAVLSVLMAGVYSKLSAFTSKSGLSAVGGPAFTRIACGIKSVRYFVSRLSMSVANTALAAYCAIIFFLFDIQYVPILAKSWGLSGSASDMIVYLVALIFVGWFIINAIYERRFLKAIGRAQVVLTSVVVVLLIYQGLALGGSGSWNLAGLANTGVFTSNWIFALLTNTAYLYILFFGFQEIQSLERDAVEESPIPILSWLKRGYKVKKSRYLGVAMISSVIVAVAINIFYAISVYAAHPNYSALQASSIPALYIAGTLLGNTSETLMGIAFLIATLTTFVPAFLAASRHLGSLSEDGFLPKSVSKIAWIFTLVSIGLLAIAGQNFLVNITDFMVLISLGFIAFSALWIRKKRRSPIETQDALPIVVGLGCFISAGALYFISPEVAVFGAVALAVAYLIYDLFELESLGTQLFLAVFDAVCFIALSLYPNTFSAQSFFLFDWLGLQSMTTTILATSLLISCFLLLISFGLDFIVMRANRAETRLVSVPKRGKN